MNKSLSHLKPTLEIVKSKNEIKCFIKFVGKIPAEIKKEIVNPDGVLRLSYTFDVSNIKLVERFKKAVEDNKIFTNPFIKSGGGVWDDSFKKPRWIEPFKYLDCEGFMAAKYLNSELKALGC